MQTTSHFPLTCYSFVQYHCESLIATCIAIGIISWWNHSVNTDAMNKSIWMLFFPPRWFRLFLSYLHVCKLFVYCTRFFWKGHLKEHLGNINSLSTSHCSETLILLMQRSKYFAHHWEQLPCNKNKKKKDSQNWGGNMIALPNFRATSSTTVQKWPVIAVAIIVNKWLV